MYHVLVMYQKMKCPHPKIFLVLGWLNVRNGEISLHNNMFLRHSVLILSRFERKTKSEMIEEQNFVIKYNFYSAILIKVTNKILKQYI
jgi:hypothetical protein